MTTMNISYTDSGWGIRENRFQPDKLAKTEVIMAQGNGYLGIRAASEEKYAFETRNFFVNGTFNKGFDNEVTELPNLPDVLAVELSIDHQLVDFSRGVLHSYSKTLDMKTGELIREVIWETKNTGKVQLTYRRMVSMDDLHLVVQNIRIVPMDKSVMLDVKSGIDGQVTNSGTQHFPEGEKRYIKRKIMTLNNVTSESNIKVMTATTHREAIDDKKHHADFDINIERRRIYGQSSLMIPKGSSYELTKYSSVHTSRDMASGDRFSEGIEDFVTKKMLSVRDTSYAALLKASADVWKKIWFDHEIQVDSKEPFDQTALRFAQYHLQIMTSANDNRMGVGAKGLTGEGYKGHSFWDTEIFILPYFLYTQPDIARNLLAYRYLTLQGARDKALKNGYEGAMFPWESAWLEDGEVTPTQGPADIVTGTDTKILTGEIEQHVTADIAYMVNRYYEITDDESFMIDIGYKLLFETASFWASRLEEGSDGKLHINNVIGPDEYKEHVDDNAYTNYMAHLNLSLAVDYGKKLQIEKSGCWQTLNRQYDLKDRIMAWESRLNRLYLPELLPGGVLPQDSTYLNKPKIDLRKYRQQKNVGSIFKDYNLSQINEVQVTKQADVLLLFYLREELFDKEVKQINWLYYEPRTLHDSSLSFATHAIIASDIANSDTAYEMFTKAREIDLGQNMDSCDAGIHAASLGGLAQVVINGFGGVRVLGGKLRIEPQLPTNWHRLAFKLHWKMDVLAIEVTKESLTINRLNSNDKNIEFSCYGKTYVLENQISIPLERTYGRFGSHKQMGE